MVKKYQKIKQTRQRNNLEENKQWLLQAVENANEIIIVTQAGFIKYYNPKAIQLTGYLSQELTSQPITEFIHLDDRDRVLKDYYSQLRGEETAGVYTFRIIDKAGQVRWVEKIGVQITWEGQPALLCMISDITSHKQVEEELRRRDRELALLNRIIAASAATPSKDQEAILEVACRELALALNVPHAVAALLDKMKTTITVVAEYSAGEGLAILPQAWPVVDDPLGQYLLSHKTPLVTGEDLNNPHLDLIHNHLRQQGIASLLLVPLVIEGEVVGSLGLASLEPRRFSTEEINLTWSVADQLAGVLARVRLEEKRRQLEEQYYQAQKMEAVGRLTAGVAHDFNNLLTTINGFAALMQRELRPDDPQWEMADIILRSGQRAAGLVRQLLAFSRKQIIQPQVLNLNSILVELDKMLQRVIGEDIDLKIRLAPELWPVKVDPAQMEQVILNLVVNARDAMSTGGQLTIETANVVIDDNYVADHLDTQLGKYVLLAISDTGCGMSPEVKAHIFEPFFTTKERGHGTGLGLATVFGIIKQSGGNIWVYSEEGMGTTFKIYLPSVAEKKSEPPVDPEVGVEMPGGSETILLVEDDAGVRALLRQVLSPLGYTLLEAGNGQEALRLLADYPDPIHLLLTDVVMPGISGKTLAEEASRTRPDLKMLFMSGYTDEAIVQHGVPDAEAAFLQKPFSLMALAAKIRSVLDNLPDKGEPK
jgi:PAS domain S-box-containing protein